MTHRKKKKSILGRILSSDTESDLFILSLLLFNHILIVLNNLFINFFLYIIYFFHLIYFKNNFLFYL